MGVVAGVAVMMKLVGLLSGVSNGAVASVTLRIGTGVCVFNKGLDGGLNCGSCMNIISRTPMETKTPKTEKAFFARIVFCWRVM